ncbi:MAG TPA: hypothetical protein VG964_00710 [Candidatus Saccharimonadales bacterium]|nr:hypothetical protein [Candidatus Saccharimonadales bacterium]
MKRFLGSLFVSLVLVCGTVDASSIGFSVSSVSKTKPCQNSTVTYTAKIVNSSKKAVSGARVSFKVYYKTTTTSYDAGKTNSKGVASKKFKIGRATLHYKVKIKAKATKSGLTATSTAAFTPSCK